MKMNKLPATAYVGFGALNAAFSGMAAWVGLVVWIELGLMCAPEIVAIVSTAAVGAVVLMRAPFSNRNIDRPWVDVLRWALSVAYGYVAVIVCSSGFEEMDWVTASMLAVIVVTVSLLVLMPRIRGRRG